ncbi:MAG: hypothetical protein M1834_007670 [Cirrosporium novae-zelandiae]|nr:MAG: hypothetical protein M1834_007670 [Cirrosporium novae-zelandiae]
MGPQLATGSGNTSSSQLPFTATSSTGPGSYVPSPSVSEDSTSLWSVGAVQPTPSAHFTSLSKITKTRGKIPGASPHIGSTHAKIHKRNGSGSSTTAQSRSALPLNSGVHLKSPLASEESNNMKWNKSKIHSQPDHAHYTFTPADDVTSPAAKLKPLLRKLSPEERKHRSSSSTQSSITIPKKPTRVDLSRSTAENAAAGLGIYTSHLDEYENYQNTNSNYSSRRGHTHIRSLSSTSTATSSTSSHHGVVPGQPKFAHPLKQTPRPYTPPTFQAPITPTATENDEADTSTSFFAPQPRTPTFALPNPSAQLTSQHHSRSDTISTFTTATTAATSRTSMDTISTMRSLPIQLPRPHIHSQRCTTDPIARQAAVEAARRAFEEREAKKEKRYREKEERKQRRSMDGWLRNGSGRASLSEIERGEKEPDNGVVDAIIHESVGVMRSPSGATAQTVVKASEKLGDREAFPLFTTNSAPAVPATSAFQSSNEKISAPIPGATQQNQKKGRSGSGTSTLRSSRKKVQSSWVLFITWLRTRILKMRKKLGMTI